jgi:hypothetical protein
MQTLPQSTGISYRMEISIGWDGIEAILLRSPVDVASTARLQYREVENGLLATEPITRRLGVS